MSGGSTGTTLCPYYEDPVDTTAVFVSTNTVPFIKFKISYLVILPLLPVP